MATIAIGDIHGNLLALNDLLATLESFLEPADELVFLGDYIDNGPDVAGCIDRIVGLRANAPYRVVPLVGNHEQWMLRSRSDHTWHSWLLGMAGLRTVASYSPAAAEILQGEIQDAAATLYLDAVPLSYDKFFDALPKDHLEFFDSLQVYYQSSDVLCVHGGCAGNDDPIDDLPSDTLIWGPRGFPGEYDSTQVVVYGHHNDANLDDQGWPRPQVTRDLAFGIDTILHGVLTAMRFPDRAVFQSGRFLIETQD